MSLRTLTPVFRNLAVASTSVASVQPFQCLCNQMRNFTFSAKLLKSLAEEHPAPKISEAQKFLQEGTVGAEHWLSVNQSRFEESFPTPETLHQSFDGIPFKELPIVHIKATKNNTLINAVTFENQPIIYTSCRLEGFKNAKKKTQIAGHATGVAAGQKLLRRGVKAVRIKLKGLGPGRMTSIKGLTVAGVQVISITDVTELKELGPRPKKQRRVG
ncbi:unnamed protein product [Enterobius vermicularis]|uniref:Ribosomal protein S11 n=1 Tax=Enterobius vermicularis TaxID=51028 RepID=A0A0N4V6T5_ENTVE|nr:unnamed protein product [Enterobius vermicularis]